MSFDILKKPGKSATVPSKDVFARLDGDEVTHYVNLYRRYIAADFESGAGKLPVVTLPMRDKHLAEANVKRGSDRKRLAVMPDVEEAWTKSASQLDLLPWLHRYDGKVTLLDGKAVDLNAEPPLRYLQSQAEREPYRVTFGTGNRVLQASTPGGETRPLPAGSYMVVIGLDGFVYMAQEKRNEFNHASIFAAKEILGADEGLVSSDGRLLTATAAGSPTSPRDAIPVRAANNPLVELKNKSGHYRPQAAHTIQFLYLLELNGLDLSKVILLVFRKKGQDGPIRGRFIDADIKAENRTRSPVSISKNSSSPASPLTPQQAIEVLADVTLELPEPAMMRDLWENHPLSQ